MKLGIMQPYFFPYLGYFDLINYTDKWIVFDTAQYIRHGWVNRNRVLHPHEGWMYVTVPVKQNNRWSIRDIEILDWRKSALGKLAHYRNSAPHAGEVIELVKACPATGSISRLNTYALDLVCDRLGIPFDYEFFSEMNLDLGSIDGPGDWALRISEAMGAEEYANPSGGIALFDPDKFQDAGIKLTIRDILPMEYDCGDYKFIPGLSVIDVMMWNEPETIRAYLEEQR